MSLENQSDNTRLSWLVLFTSTATLICCALPILLVTLGFGSVVAALTSHYPLLVTLSEYEGWMFGISALLPGLSAWFIWGHQAHDRKCCFAGSGQFQGLLPDWCLQRLC